MKHPSITVILAVLLLVLSVSLVYAQNPWSNGQPATFVIGQPDFTSSGDSTTAITLDWPGDVAVDVVNGKLYVADTYNHRVLRYVYPIAGNQPAAELVFGQPNLNTALWATTRNQFAWPSGVAVDSSGRLWVADTYNSRVVWFDNADAIATDQPDADGVLGQPDFTTGITNTTQSRMWTPLDLAIDATGTLFVADTDNNRVLRFDNAASKADGANADGVLGQALYNTNTFTTTQSGMDSPRGVALAGTSLFVSDRSNARVLRFDDAVNKANGANADGVLGQPDFTSNTKNITQAGMDGPGRVAVDAGGRLYVSDAWAAARVLIFNDAVSKANGGPADNVLGQVNFTNYGGATAQNRLDTDSAGGGMAVDSVNGRLLVADTRNSRVMWFGPVPFLSIDKSGPGTADPGTPISYTLTITNTGPTTATTVVVTDVVPTGARYASGGTLIPGNVVIWTVPSLAQLGGSAQVQFVVTATETITNSVYGVSCTQDVSAVGTEEMVTTIGSGRIYLPVVLKEQPSA